MKLIDMLEKKNDYTKLKHIYKASFPSYERMPLFMLINSITKKNGFDLLGIYVENTLIGFFYVISQNDICLILFFAIGEHKRSKGYGSKALELIKEHFINHRIFLYIEKIDIKADNYKQQVDRKGFYLRNNYKSTNFEIKLFTNVFEVLISGNQITQEEYENILKKMTRGFNLAKVISNTT